MACGVDRPADGGDVAGHAGRGLVVDHEHTLDLVGRVGAQRLLNPVGRSSLPPRHVDDVHGKAVPAGALDEAVAEVAVAHPQQAVAR